MPRVPFLAQALCLLVVLAAAHPASAFDGCRAADVDGSGDVDFHDLTLIQAAISLGLPDPRLDLDGSGLPDRGDLAMAFGRIFHTCADCTADLDADGDVDADDRALLEAAYGRICLLDMDRNDIVNDPDDLDLWTHYFQSLPTPAKDRADFDGNGTVNFIDISLLLPTVGNDCAPDLNKDGEVNTIDLWFLLASWGPCP